MILRLRHAVTFAYDPPLAPATHLLHLRPRALAWQRVLGFTVAAAPTPSRQRDGTDHFGNPVAWMFHDEPHARFEIASEASVEVLPRLIPAATPPWEQIADAARNQAWAWREAEFTFPSPLAPPLPEARRLALPSFPPGRPIGEAATCLARRIGQEFRLQSDDAAPTSLAQPPLARVLARREGPSQDLAHAMIAGLRSFGLPARYVSGYVLRPVLTSDGPIQEGGRCWVGCWLGPGLGWLDLDPTTGNLLSQESVCVAWGRDRADVSPRRTVVLGERTQVLRVSVALDPVAACAGE